MTRYRIQHPPQRGSRFLTALLLMGLLFTGCSKSNKVDLSSDTPFTITITDIKNLPSDLKFNRVSADLIGYDWGIIGRVEAPNAQVIKLRLPESFQKEQLQLVNRLNGDLSGYWPASSTNTEARVATLGDIIAYDGDTAVGRLYLTSSTNPAKPNNTLFIKYQFASEAFELEGRNSSYTYKECLFVEGWNTFAHKNINESYTVCTTLIPEDTELYWLFESWIIENPSLPLHTD